MLISQILQKLELLVPLSLQESYDNAGLITGNDSLECTGILTCLDCIPEIVEEAVNRNCNLIIAHHPIIFKGIKSLTGKNYIEKTLLLAIKNNISIYACHTNLDSIHGGVNFKIAEKLGLTDVKILDKREDVLLKLAVFVPETHKEQLKNALFLAGGGRIGNNYDECSFETSGLGNFRPLKNSNPYSGSINKRQVEKESKLEIIFPFWQKGKILEAMLKNHPYEEVAYDIYRLSNSVNEYGIGVTGNLKQPLPENEFLSELKEKFNLKVIKHTALPGKVIKKVALCGGSGIFLLKKAISAKADVYITSDVKYHEFFDADGKIILADIGHYESEQFTVELLHDIIRENFPNFAVLKTNLNTNPVRYFS